MRNKLMPALVLLALCGAGGARAYTEGDVPAAALLKAVKEHAKLFPETLNKFQTDMENPKNISMYGMTNATTWTADMDVDCDGTATTNCNKSRDPWFQNQLSIGVNLSAEATPYFVIPIGSPSNSSSRGIAFGQIAAVIYQDQVVFAVFVDECGVSSLIGEASYATNKLLGVNPDPANGGTDGPVTYIVFTGTSGRLTKDKYTSHDAAMEIGNARAKELMAAYSIDYGSTAAKAAPAAAPASYRLSRASLTVETQGAYTVSLADFSGRKLMTKSGAGPASYATGNLQPGLYVVTLASKGSTRTEKVAVF